MNDMIMRDVKNGIPFPTKKSFKKDLLQMVALTGLGAAALVIFTECQPKPKLTECMGCHRKAAYTAYFQKAGSKSPQEMAEAVLATKNPRLMAAIAKIETGGNPHIRNTGYKKRHDGAFQIASKHHGKVSHDVVEQALQAEMVLVGMLSEEKSIIPALNAYAGHTDKKRGRYAYNVLAELSQVP